MSIDVGTYGSHFLKLFNRLSYEIQKEDSALLIRRALCKGICVANFRLYLRGLDQCFVGKST